MTPIAQPPASPKTLTGALLAGALATLLASACCLGPLLLVLLGVSGAWIGSLSALEAYQPFFIGVSVVALSLAAWRLWMPAAACPTDRPCTKPPVLRAYRLVFVGVLVLLLLVLGFPLIAHWFY